MKKLLVVCLVLVAGPVLGAQMPHEAPLPAAQAQTPSLTAQDAKEIYILLQGASMNVRDMQEVSRLLNLLAGIANSGK